jgi:hypothetical protein
MLAASLTTSTATAPLQPITIRDAKLPAQVKREIIASLMNSASGEDGDLHQMALDSEVTFLKLSPTGPRAIEVNGTGSLCAPNGSGNCPFSLFELTKGHAALILEGSGQGLAILKSMHHGRFDISQAERLGHTLQFRIEVDQFDGKAYGSAYCYSETIDENDHTTQTPHQPC